MRMVVAGGPATPAAVWTAALAVRPSARWLAGYAVALRDPQSSPWAPTGNRRWEGHDRPAAGPAHASTERGHRPALVNPRTGRTPVESISCGSPEGTAL